jgi:hypothetical protein
MPAAGAGRPDEGLARFLVPWLAAALAGCYLAFAGWPRPAWWQFVLQVGLAALIARTQWKLGRGWLRSTLLPAGVFFVFTGFSHAPTPPYQAAFYLIGLIGAVAWVIRAVHRRWRVPVALGTAVALLVVIATRWVDAWTMPRVGWGEAPSAFGDLLWPLHVATRRQPTTDRPALVVLSVDTLRADAAVTMETYRRLAARGAVWERAMSTSSWTLPALASLQTGLMPAEHGAGCLEDGHCQGLASDVRLLAEELRAQGFETAAVVNNPWVGTRTGFDRGFDLFADIGSNLSRLIIGGPPLGLHRQDDARAVDAALAWLDHVPPRGFYLWVHLFGPHLPYRHAAAPYLRTLDGVALRSSYPLSTARRDAIRAAYAGEVAYADRQLLRLLDALQRRGVLDGGVVVLTADHGEEFWDHGGVEHGHSHHGEVVDVPLVLVAPGVAPGARSGVASLIDVAPTLRAVAGLPPDGIDLREGEPDGRYAAAWGGLVQHLDCSVRDPGRRVILRDCSADPPSVQAFDLVRDPHEFTPVPLSPDDPLFVAARAVRAPRLGAKASLPVERLRALGYLQ